MGTSQTRAKNKYNKANYDTLLLSMPVGNKSRLQKVASDRNISVNKLLNNFIDELLNKDTYISIEQEKVQEELNQEAQVMAKDLATLRNAVETKPKGTSEEYLERRKGYAPMPKRKLIKLWYEKREKGYSYADLVEFTKELTGHKFAPKTIGTQLEGFLEQVKIGLVEPLL